MHAEVAEVEIEPFNSGGSEDDGIVLAIFQPLDAGGYVAPEGLNVQVGPEEKELIPATHRRCTNGTSLFQGQPSGIAMGFGVDKQNILG